MKTIQEEQIYVLDRIGVSLADLEYATDPFQIEAHIFLIAQIAEISFKRVHLLNAKRFGFKESSEVL